MKLIKRVGILFSGSWDRKVTAWDVRGECRIMNMRCPEKVYSMDVGGNMLVVALSNRLINVYDTRRLGEPLQTRESALKFQTRCVRVSAPVPSSFICTSIEGRVAVEYFDLAPEVQASKYAFKCHREMSHDNPGHEIVYPVNAAAFHPIFGTFCTGGSDGVVCLWDAKSRKRIRNYPRLHSGISTLAFTPDGSRLAIGASYTYDEGEKEYVMCGAPLLQPRVSLIIVKVTNR